MQVTVVPRPGVRVGVILSGTEAAEPPSIQSPPRGLDPLEWHTRLQTWSPEKPLGLIQHSVKIAGLELLNCIIKPPNGLLRRGYLV